MGMGELDSKLTHAEQQEFTLDNCVADVPVVVTQGKWLKAPENQSQYYLKGALINVMLQSNATCEELTGQC